MNQCLIMQLFQLLLLHQIQVQNFYHLVFKRFGVDGGNGWSDDGFADLDEIDDDDFMSQFEKKDFIRPRSAAGVGSKLITPTRATASSRRGADLIQKKSNNTKVSVTKLAMNSGIDDGWEDF